MSLAAYVWVQSLPMDATPTHRAFRVLLKMADVADADGRNVWLSKARIAEELVTSLSTVTRALQELRLAGLIVDGDKRAVAHLKGNRRPNVYDLNMRAIIAPQLDISGVSELTPQSSRGVNSRRLGVSTGDTQTVSKPVKQLNSRNHRGSAEPVDNYDAASWQADHLIPCKKAPLHDFDPEMFCRACGYHLNSLKLRRLNHAR